MPWLISFLGILQDSEIRLHKYMNRKELAESLFRQGFNCAQAVVLSFEDVAASRGITREQLSALASGFGGGMGRMREVCGCVSGMTLIAGLLSPADPSCHASRTTNYALVQKFAGEFGAQNGSIVCRELLGLRTAAKESPEPERRTEHYYKSRPCEQLVGCAAEIVADYLEKMS